MKAYAKRDFDLGNFGMNGNFDSNRNSGIQGDSECKLNFFYF